MKHIVTLKLSDSTKFQSNNMFHALQIILKEHVMRI